MHRAMIFRCGLLLLLLCHVGQASFGASINVTLPTLIDSDGDGLDDETEALLGTNPAKADSDGDDWDDLAEVVLGTDPSDPADFPHDTLPGELPFVPGDPSLRLKVQELLNLRLARSTPDQTAPKATGPEYSLSYYYPKDSPTDLAVELRHADLKAGSYLLLWRHHVGWNPLGLEQRYVVKIQDTDGRIIREWHTPAPVDLSWNHVGLPFLLKPAEEGRALTLSVTPADGGHLDYALADFGIVPAGIEADVDRDGVISPNERPSSDRPLRHWINDDDDQGECQERSDVPGRPANETDFAQPGIDGLRDLVDFIPLNLDLARVVTLLRPSAGFRYFVVHPDQAVHLVLTGLSPANAGQIHREASVACFGENLDRPVSNGSVLRPDEDGRIEIPANFMARIESKGHGVVLLEGGQESRRPLLLEVRQDERAVATFELPLSLGRVESMYRHVNLCRTAYEYSGRPAPIKKPGRPTQTDDPTGLPDGETNDRWVVMLHGYNVSGDAARGWHAESFKRLRALGSNARFVGITWNGDTGLDYHKAVYQAFQSGDAVPGALTFADPSRTLLVAHSLGNVVACQAIQAGFTPAHCFMLNAALPIEAIAGEVGSPDQAKEMTELLWRPYPRRLFMSDWYRSHPLLDQRRTYTWTNAFSRVRRLGSVSNCYSAGEDVTNCPKGMVSASVLATLWSGRAVDYGVWKTQELLKGVGWSRSIGAIAMERPEAGWGFNPAWRGRFIPNAASKAAGGYYEKLPPELASALTAEQLSKAPFFTPLKESWLHEARPARLSPLLDSPHIRYDLLARAVPAMSYAAGASPIPSSGPATQLRNFDLEASGRTPGRWPSEGHTTPVTSGRWLHSDFKNAALPFVHPLFAKMIESASLR